MAFMSFIFGDSMGEQAELTRLCISSDVRVEPSACSVHSRNWLHEVFSTILDVSVVAEIEHPHSIGKSTVKSAAFIMATLMVGVGA